MLWPKISIVANSKQHACRDVQHASSTWLLGQPQLWLSSHKQCVATCRQVGYYAAKQWVHDISTLVHVKQAILFNTLIFNMYIAMWVSASCKQFKYEFQCAVRFSG